MTSNNLPGVIVSEEVLVVDTDGPNLRGSKCNHCGEVYFPKSAGCTNCQGTELEEINLGHSGKLWSWTVQGFLPKPPYNSGETVETFKPYGVGYIEMSTGIKIHTRLTTTDTAALRIGARFELVLESYGATALGQPLLTFAFQPCEKERFHE